MRSFFKLRLLAALLREINPLWVLAVCALAIAIAGSSVVRQHVRDSTRLQHRLTGSSLVDALKLYAEATPRGQAMRPASIDELADDQRGGEHRNWLDAASAESLRDARQWHLLRDDDGRLRGARLEGEAGEARSAWPGWLGSAADDPAAAPVYAIDAGDAADAPQARAAATEAQATPLPQPVMPDTPLDKLSVQRKVVDASPPAAAASGQRRLQVPVPAGAAPAEGTASAPVQARGAGAHPSRIIAGLEARQVLRLSGGDADEPPLTARKRPHAAATAAVPASGAAAVPAPGAAAVPAAEAKGRAVAAGALALPAPTAKVQAASGAARQAAPGPIATPGAMPKRLYPIEAAATRPRAQGTLRKWSGANPSQPALDASPVALAAPSGPAVAGGLIERGAAAASLATAATAGAAASAPLPAATLPLVPAAPLPAPVPLASSAVGAAPANPSAAAGAASPMMGPSLSALPAAGSRPPEARVDTVIYEESQTPAGDPHQPDCHTLSGDSAECDSFEEDDPTLYQRCYQSLSERINACIAGEPIPPLVVR